MRNMVLILVRTAAFCALLLPAYRLALAQEETNQEEVTTNSSPSNNQSQEDRLRRTYSMVQFVVGQTLHAFQDDCLDGCGFELWECEKTPQKGCGRKFDRCERRCKLAAGLQADLMPVPAPQTAAFCGSVGGKLQPVFKVRNVGSAMAPASVARVNFPGNGVAIDVPIPALLPGEESPVQTAVPPAGCFAADCQYTITVDSQNGVNESSESNNTVHGACIG